MLYQLPHAHAVDCISRRAPADRVRACRGRGGREEGQEEKTEKAIGLELVSPLAMVSAGHQVSISQA